MDGVDDPYHVLTPEAGDHYVDERGLVRRVRGSPQARASEFRGQRNEMRVFSALRSVLPDSARVRFASAEEDAQGVDLVVEHRDGRVVPVQVKSRSREARRVHRRHELLGRPEVVAVGADCDDSALRVRVRQALAAGPGRSR